MPAIGIESLQKMGTKFILCANALGIWCLELEARGKGKAPDLEKDLRANVLPGVTIVPAMVIAIEKALVPDKPDVAQVTAMVNEVMRLYNEALAEIVKDARARQ